MDNFYSRCLLCTCTPNVTQNLHIFSEAGCQMKLAEKINKYLNIQIKAELPQNVCHRCVEKLEVTHELVTSSQQANMILLQMKQQSDNQTKTPPTLKEDTKEQMAQISPLISSIDSPIILAYETSNESLEEETRSPDVIQIIPDSDVESLASAGGCYGQANEAFLLSGTPPIKKEEDVDVPDSPFVLHTFDGAMRNPLLKCT